MDIQKLLDVCDGGPVYIQTHDYPDPDAIASAYALQHFLEHFGIAASLCCIGQADHVAVLHAMKEFDVQFVPHVDVMRMGEDEKIILVDCQKKNANMTELAGKEIACIDHHPIFADVKYEYSDIRIVGACASILADYYEKADIPLPQDVATFLLYGLHIDTDFLTRGVADLDLEVFPRLYRLADHGMVELLETRSLTLNDLHAFGTAINNVEVHERTGFVFIPFSCSDALIAQVADFILTLAEVDVAIIYSQRDTGLKFSVRNVGAALHGGHMLRSVMPPFGNGGGHAKMAGGFIKKEAIEESGMGMGDFLRMIQERFMTYIKEHHA